MKISVVIPAYNEEKLLPHCLKALQNQTIPKRDFEVIVVDNNSTDKTSQIAQKYGARVVFEAKKGIIHARAKGASSAKGEIIVCMDADSIASQDYLKKILMAFNDTSIVGICGKVSVYDAPFIIRHGARFTTTLAHYYSKIFKDSLIVWAPSFAFRRKAFEKAGGYSLNLPLLVAGINTHRSDETDLKDKLKTATGKKILFCKDATISISGRRFKNRLLYWLVVEHIIGFLLNDQLEKHFGIIIPIASYDNRVNPERFYTYTHRLALATTTVIALFIGSAWFIVPDNNKQQYAQDIQQKAETQYKKIAAIKDDVEKMSSQLNIEKITPYIKQYTTSESFQL